MKQIFLLLYLVVLSLFDCKERRIPIILLALGFLLAVGGSLYASATSGGNGIVSIIEMGVGTLPGILLLLLAWVTKKIGWGDGVVVVIIGLVEGFRYCTVLLCFSALMAAVVSAILLVLHKVNRQTSLPYLPFLTVTCLAGILM